MESTSHPKLDATRWAARPQILDQPEPPLAKILAFECAFPMSTGNSRRSSLGECEPMRRNASACDRRALGIFSNRSQLPAQAFFRDVMANEAIRWRIELPGMPWHARTSLDFAAVPPELSPSPAGGIRHCKAASRRSAVGFFPEMVE